MELSRLVHLLKPAFLEFFKTRVTVVTASAHLCLPIEKEGEKQRDHAGERNQSVVAVTLDTTQALLIPITSSCLMLIMFYLFPRCP
uniref:Uncharacterized protein n=1 Tax=Physcomitrium patens TaxID=3218 RepID=A0A2K1KPY9_PHYPA|nr:hypothetical protein PHYPA_006734 [Physcomitrium patens]